MEGMHKWGLKPLILGLVILANIYLLKKDWWLVFGWLLVICGIVKMLMPCKCCKPPKKK